MALDIFSVGLHGLDNNRPSETAHPVAGGFTELLMSALANKGLAGAVLAPGLEIARNLATDAEFHPEPKAMTAAAPHSRVDGEPGEQTAISDTNDDADSDDAEPQVAESEDTTTGDVAAGPETTEIANVSGAMAAQPGAPRGGIAEAGSLATLLNNVGANEAALSAVTHMATAGQAAPLHTAAQAGVATVIQQAQNGARATQILQALQSNQPASVAVAGKNPSATIPGATVTQSAPGLTSRPMTALSPAAAVASMPAGAAVKPAATVGATVASNTGSANPTVPDSAQTVVQNPSQNAMPAPDKNGPMTTHTSTGNGAPAPGIGIDASPPMDTGIETASLRADRPVVNSINGQQSAAKGQAQAQSTPAGAAAARADAVVAPAIPTAPSPTHQTATAPRPAPMAQAVLPMSGSEAGTGTSSGDAGGGFNPLANRPGAQVTAKPQIQRPLPANTPAADQIAVNIQRAIAAGTDRIQIRMVPANLGRVDVQLELSRGQRIKAVIMAEKPETLDLLQRDARQLERALQQAGLQTDHDSLEFSLRDGNGGTATAQHDNTGRDTGSTADAGDIADDPALTGSAPAHIVTDDRIDVHV